jgi:hypothetical protein
MLTSSGFVHGQLASVQPFFELNTAPVIAVTLVMASMSGRLSVIISLISGFGR